MDRSLLPQPWLLWGLALGFALGGFFDGILLHQILQWHHLLSLVSGAGDLRQQVLWDGLFHLLMYLIAAFALLGLWCTRLTLPPVNSNRFAGALLVGFGGWHVVDAVLSHWLMGIHRIRIDSEYPLVWDMAWAGLFGLVPLALGGWLMTRRRRAPRRTPSSTALGLLTAAVIGVGGWSTLSPPGQPFTTVVFLPGLGSQDVVTALAAVDARLLWSDPALGVVVVVVEPARRWALYRQGALLVSGSGMPVGCVSWSRV